MPTRLLRLDGYISAAERAVKHCKVWVASDAATIARFPTVHCGAMWAQKSVTQITRFEFENEILLADKR